MSPDGHWSRPRAEIAVPERVWIDALYHPNVLR
jgi:hypothetical protein